MRVGGGDISYTQAQLDALTSDSLDGSRGRNVLQGWIRDLQDKADIPQTIYRGQSDTPSLKWMTRNYPGGNDSAKD